MKNEPTEWSSLGSKEFKIAARVILVLIVLLTILVIIGNAFPESIFHAWSLKISGIVLIICWIIFCCSVAYYGYFAMRYKWIPISGLGVKKGLIAFIWGIVFILLSLVLVAMFVSVMSIVLFTQFPIFENVGNISDFVFDLFSKIIALITSCLLCFEWINHKH